MVKKGILGALLVAVFGLSLAGCSSDCNTCTNAPVYKRPCDCGTK